jgi:hypothetical protein
LSSGGRQPISAYHRPAAHNWFDGGRHRQSIEHMQPIPVPRPEPEDRPLRRLRDQASDLGKKLGEGSRHVELRRERISNDPAAHLPG